MFPNLFVAKARITHDFEYDEQRELVKLRLATPQKRGKETCFYSAHAWGNTARFLSKYAKKGSTIYLTGELQLDEWTDREGERRSRLGVLIEQVDLPPRPKAEAEVVSENARFGPQSAKTPQGEQIPMGMQNGAQNGVCVENWPYREEAERAAEEARMDAQDVAAEEAAFKAEAQVLEGVAMPPPVEKTKRRSKKQAEMDDIPW